jgi:hypothetical protein
MTLRDTPPSSDAIKVELILNGEEALQGDYNSEKTVRRKLADEEFNTSF